MYKRIDMTADVSLYVAMSSTMQVALTTTARQLSQNKGEQEVGGTSTTYLMARPEAGRHHSRCRCLMQGSNILLFSRTAGLPPRKGFTNNVWVDCEVIRATRKPLHPDRMDR